MGAYRICTRCVMDTSDPDIRFDEQGVCSHCHEHDLLVRLRVIEGEKGWCELERISARIKRDGSGSKYDCVIGLSGGVDSSYTAWLAKRLGLRPLAVHLDNGWNSEVAVRNIEQLVRRLGLELRTYVIDWEEFRDLQLAFLKASTPDSEVPTDHAINSLLRLTARSEGIRHVLSGANIRTETHLPRAWSQGHWDWKYIRSIHKQFGTIRLRTYPRTRLVQGYVARLTQQWVWPLNYVDFVKQDAKELLRSEVGWCDYGAKHSESIYTRFYQGYILPRKFGFDKRRSHLSALVCSGQMGREEALRELERDPYPPELQQQDLQYVVKKLGITHPEFDAIMALSPKSYHEYPSYDSFYRGQFFRGARFVYRRIKAMAPRRDPALAGPF